MYAFCLSGVYDCLVKSPSRPCPQVIIVIVTILAGNDNGRFGKEAGFAPGCRHMSPRTGVVRAYGGLYDDHPDSGFSANNLTGPPVQVS